MEHINNTQQLYNHFKNYEKDIINSDNININKNDEIKNVDLNINKNINNILNYDISTTVLKNKKVVKDNFKSYKKKNAKGKILIA